MSDFKPYEKEQEYKVVLTKDEALIIQRMRAIKYGSIVVHFVAGKPKRTEITNSEQMNEPGFKGEVVTIALEVIGN